MTNRLQHDNSATPSANPQDSEDNLRRFVQYAPVSLAMFDRNMHYIAASQRWVEVHQFESVEAIVGRSHYEVFPELPDRWRQVHQRGLAGETQKCDEDCFTLADGSLQWERWEVQPWRTESGEIGGIIILTEDIGDRKRAEEALQAANQRVLTAWESMTDAYLTLDREWRIIYANQAAVHAIRSLVHLEPEAFMGKSHWDVFPWCVGQPVEQEYRRAMAEQIAVHLEVLYEPTGNWFETHAYPSEAGLGVYFRDISDRKQAQEALRNSEAQLRQLADAMPQQVWITDADGQTQYVNQQWVDYTGLTLAQSQDISAAAQVIHPDDRDRVSTSWRNCLATGSLYQAEVRFKRSSDDSYRWFLSRAIPIHNQQGQNVQWFGTNTDIDDFKRTEAALQESESRLSLAIDSAGMATWDINMQTGVGIWSQSHYPMLGHEPQSSGEATFEMWHSCVHPDDLEQVMQAIDYAQQTRSLYSPEYRILRADTGEVRWLKAFGRFVDDERQGLRFIGVLFDESDRKQAEIALQDSQAIIQQQLLEIEAIYETAPIGLVILDTDLRFQRINQRLAEINGHSIEAHLGRTIREILPDLADTVEPLLRQVLETGEPLLNVEVIGETKARPGVQRTWLEDWFPLKGADGRSIGINIVVHEITDRKQAELEREQHLANERRYNEQLQGLTTASLAINSALSVQEVLQVITDQAAAIVGSHQSVTSLTIDHNWAQAITAVYLSDKYAQWRDYDELTDGTGIYACVCHLNRPMRMTQAELETHPHWKSFGKEAGKHPPMRGWLAAPLVGREGQNIGLIQLSDKFEGDFTATDEAVLVQLAQMASIALENARLYEAEQQAREQAQAANRIKDEFLAVLSHELRSPLNPILGWSKLLQTGRLNETQTQQALSTIERNAKLQAELIEDLLDVSRILQGKLNLNIAPVSLSTTIEGAIETVRLAAEAKSISIQAHLDPHVGQVSGDATRLQQVVWNLLSNAVKFTPQGGRVEVRLEEFAIRNSQFAIPNSELRIANYARLTISDTGIGISSDFLPYVFDYFRQEDGKTTRKFGGLGLGLAIVQHIIELHGGTVQADSLGEGQGATFTVMLPLMRLPAAAESDRPAAELLNLNGVQILVIDDEADSREFVAFVLEQAGAKVITATSAVEGLDALRRSTPDLLLSDIGMPDLDGYMLMRQVRSLPPDQGGKTPSIALTAYAGDFNQQQALEAGFQQHLAKPIEPEKLLAIVGRLVHSSPSRST